MFRILTRNCAYDASLRLRVSEGYAVSCYYGSFVRRDTIDFDMVSIDADKNIVVELKSEGSVPVGK